MKRYYFIFLLFVFPFCLYGQWYSLIPFSENGKKWGVMNMKGEMQIEAEYDSIGFFEHKWGMIIKQNGKYGILDPLNKEKPILLKPYFYAYSDTCEIVIFYDKKESVYIADTVKKAVAFVEDLYDQLNCLPPTQEQRGIFIDNPKRYQTQKNFYLIMPDENLTRVNRNEFMNYDREGVPISVLRKGAKKGLVITSFAIAKQDDKNVWGKIQSDTLPIIYDSLIINLNNAFPINPEGTNLVSNKIDCIVAFRNNKWGILNQKTEVLLPFEYDQIKVLQQEEASKYIFVQKGNLWGWIDTKTFDIVGQCKYKSIQRVSTKMDDMFFFIERVDGKKGYVGAHDGREYITPKTTP